MSKSDLTKQKIAISMKELLKTHSFEDISIETLSKYTNISRNTFYYHFKDKYDVINWIFYSDITPIVTKTYTLKTWSKGLELLCEYMQNNKEFYIKVLHVSGQNSFTECLLDFYKNLVYNLIKSTGGNQILKDEHIKIIADFYAFGLTGIITNWAKHDMVIDPKPIIKILEGLLSGEILDKILSLNVTNNNINLL